MRLEHEITIDQAQLNALGAGATMIAIVELKDKDGGVPAIQRDDSVTLSDVGGSLPLGGNHFVVRRFHPGNASVSGIWAQLIDKNCLEDFPNESQKPSSVQ